MPSTVTRAVCPTCRVVSPPVTIDHACGRCGHRVLVVPAKWRAPRRRNDRAWRAVAAGRVWWDDRAVTRSQTKAARHRYDHAQRSRTVRRAKDWTLATVHVPSGHGPVRWRPNALHPTDCRTCVTAREVYIAVLADLTGRAR